MDLSLADSGCSRISTTAGEHHFPAFLSRVSRLKHFFVARRNFCRPFLGRNLGSRVCKALRFRAVGVSQLNVVRHQTSAPPRPHNSNTKTIVAMTRYKRYTFIFWSFLIKSLSTQILAPNYRSITHADFGDQTVPMDSSLCSHTIRLDMIFEF
jgi:hypothetical protein